MERLETWNYRHGHPIEKTKNAAIYSIVGVGVVAGFVAYGFLNSGPGSTKNQDPFSNQNSY